MVGTFHPAVERDVALDHDRAQRDGADRDRDAALMAGIADSRMYAPQRFHEAQMDIVERGRIRALAMQQHIASRAIIEKPGGGADFFGRTHAGRDDQGLSGGGEAGQQRKVGEVGGGDLVGLDAERLQCGNAGRVPRRAEIANAFRRAIRRDAALLVGGQFEAAQQVEGVFDGEVVVLSGQAGSTIDLVKLAHLELGAIGAGGCRRIDQHHRAIEVAIMVVADFGNDEAGLAVANHTIANPDASCLVGGEHQVVLVLPTGRATINAPSVNRSSSANPWKRDASCDNIAGSAGRRSGFARTISKPAFLNRSRYWL